MVLLKYTNNQLINALCIMSLIRKISLFHCREDLNNIPYTMLCIKEGLRLISPVPFISREVRDSLTIDGITLKPGTLVDVPIHCIHHNQHVWGADHLVWKYTIFHAPHFEFLQNKITT